MPIWSRRALCGVLHDFLQGVVRTHCLGSEEYLSVLVSVSEGYSLIELRGLACIELGSHFYSDWVPSSWCGGNGVLSGTVSTTLLQHQPEVRPCLIVSVFWGPVVQHSNLCG